MPLRSVQRPKQRRDQSEQMITVEGENHNMAKCRRAACEERVAEFTSGRGAALARIVRGVPSCACEGLPLPCLLLMGADRNSAEELAVAAPRA